MKKQIVLHQRINQLNNMSDKKHHKADLEKSRVLFLEIGLVAALIIAVMIVEYKQSTPAYGSKQFAETELEVIMIHDIGVGKTTKPDSVSKHSDGLIIVSDSMTVNSDADFDSEVKKKHSDISEQPIDYEKKIFIYVETQPQFKGGQTELETYMTKNLRYPKAASRAEVQGRIFVSFVVMRDGKISNIRRLNSLSPETDAEAERLIADMPAWIPGKHAGQNANVYQTIAVTFKLELLN